MDSKEINFSNISTVIALTNYIVTSSIQSALGAHGIKNITTCDSVEKLKTVLPNVSPDLIICELMVPPEEIFELAKSIRLGDFGCNAYTVLMALTDNTQSQFIQKVLNAGFDDVISKPISIGLVIKRLLYLMDNRKPFIMTAGYVGPNRRSDVLISEKRSQPMDLIQAPNPLSLEAIDRKLIKSFEAAVNNIRPERSARIREEIYKEIRITFNALIENLSCKSKPEEDRPLAPELKEILGKYCDIIDRGAHNELPQVDKRLLELVTEISEHHEEAWHEDFSILQHLMDLVKHVH